MSNDRVLTVEMPDTKAIVEFLGRYGFTVKIEVGKTKAGDPEVWVKVLAEDDRSTILGEIVAEIPKSDTRR